MLVILRRNIFKLPFYISIANKDETYYSNSMLKKLLFFSMLLICSSFLAISEAHASTPPWSETRPSGDQDRSWATASLSSDGQNMLVGNQDGGLFLSTNGGSSWTSISPSGNEFDVWYVTAMSENGQVILAGVYGGYWYLSRNGGNTWTETKPAGDVSLYWVDVSMSSDGQVMLVSSELGRLYRSVDGGSTWSELRPLGDVDRSWFTKVSGNGQIIFAAEDDGNGGRLYISRDTGQTWSETRPVDASDYPWTSVSMSSDGQIMLAARANDKLYISRNGGDTWTVASAITGAWNRSSMSPDGRAIFVSSTQRLYFSDDTGYTWNETRPAGDIDKNWQLMSVSGNSRVLLVGSYDGRVYRGINPPRQTSDKASSPQCVAVPDSPDLFQINTTKTTATLYFAPVGNVSNYMISYGYTAEANEFSVMTNLGSSTGVLSYTVNDLSHNTLFYFKIYSQNDCANGNWGNSLSVKTDGKTYYKNLVSKILGVLPRQTTSLKSETVLGAATCSTYTVQAGDSLWSIASQKLGKGSLFTQIKTSNNLPSTFLHTGQTLKVGC